MNHLQPVDIDLIASCQHDVIRAQLGAIRDGGIEFPFPHRQVRHRLGLAESDLADDSIPQPVRRSRVVLPVVRILPRLRKTVEEIGHTVQHPVVPACRDGRPGSADSFQDAARVHPIRSQPRNPPPRYHLHSGAGFVQQGRIFYRALSPTDHHDVLSLESLEVAVVRGMRDEFSWELVILFRPMGKVIRSDRHHNHTAGYLTPVLQRDSKLTVPALDRRDVRLIHVGHRPPLEPQAVVDERLERHGMTLRVSRFLEELPKPVGFTGIGEVGGPPVRP